MTLLQTTNDYVRCASRNFFTRKSYQIVAAIGVFEILKKSLEIQDAPTLFDILEITGGTIAGITLYLSDFGKNTLRAYQRTRSELQSTPSVSLEMAYHYHVAPYCPKVGMQMAAQEAGLTPIQRPSLEDAVRITEERLQRYGAILITTNFPVELRACFLSQIPFKNPALEDFRYFLKTTPQDQ